MLGWGLVLGSGVQSMRAVFSLKGAEPPLDPLTKERENKGPHSGPKSGVIKGGSPYLRLIYGPNMGP